MSTLEPRAATGRLAEIADVEGGYTLFEEFAKAMPANTAQRAEQARRN
jgi:hypothetical protein